MSTYQQRRKDAPMRPAATGPSTPSAYDSMTAIVVGVDQAFRDAEAKWGCGRLVCLVSDNTRLSFQRGMDRYNAALTGGDLSALSDLAPKMRAALAFMDTEATQLGAAPLSPVVWEHRLDDGTVMAVVRTGAEASAVAAEGRDVMVWTLEEIARVLPRSVVDIKTVFPGAKVGQTVQRGEGFAADWVWRGSSEFEDDEVPF